MYTRDPEDTQREESAGAACPPNLARACLFVSGRDSILLGLYRESQSQYFYFSQNLIYKEQRRDQPFKSLEIYVFRSIRELTGFLSHREVVWLSNILNKSRQICSFMNHMVGSTLTDVYMDDGTR